MIDSGSTPGGDAVLTRTYVLVILTEAVVILALAWISRHFS